MTTVEIVGAIIFGVGIWLVVSGIGLVVGGVRMMLLIWVLLLSLGMAVALCIYISSKMGLLS